MLHPRRYDISYVYARRRLQSVAFICSSMTVGCTLFTLNDFALTFPSFGERPCCLLESKRDDCQKTSRFRDRERETLPLRAAALDVEIERPRSPETERRFACRSSPEPELWWRLLGWEEGSLMVGVEVLVGEEFCLNLSNIVMQVALPWSCRCACCLSFGMWFDSRTVVVSYDV